MSHNKVAYKERIIKFEDTNGRFMKNQQKKCNQSTSNAYGYPDQYNDNQKGIFKNTKRSNSELDNRYSYNLKEKNRSNTALEFASQDQVTFIGKSDAASSQKLKASNLSIAPLDTNVEYGKVNYAYLSSNDDNKVNRRSQPQIQSITVHPFANNDNDDDDDEEESYAHNAVVYHEPNKNELVIRAKQPDKNMKKSKKEKERDKEIDEDQKENFFVPSNINNNPKTNRNSKIIEKKPIKVEKARIRDLSSEDEDEDNNEANDSDSDIFSLTQNGVTRVEDEDDEEEKEKGVKIFPNIQSDNRPKYLKIFDYNKNDPIFRKLFDPTTYAFVMTPARRGQTLRCHITRVSRIKQQYTMHIEFPDGISRLLLISKRKQAAKIYINISAVGYADDDCKNVQTVPIGKLKSKSRLALVNNDFMLVNNGKKNGKKSKIKTKKPKSKGQVNVGNDDSDNDEQIIIQGYKEYFQASYESQKLFKFSEPMRVSIQLLIVNETEEVESISRVSTYKDKKEKRAQSEVSNVDFYIKLMTKDPMYDPKKKTFVLDFSERVKIPSATNFQIINESQPDLVILQFGKCQPNKYICDFTYPLCAFQAFGIALSCLCRKFL